MVCRFSRSAPCRFAARDVGVAPRSWAERDPIRLTHGPMLGHVTDSSVRVWGRTSDPGRSKSVRLIGSTDEPGGGDGDRRDNTGAVRVDGLEPGTVYHYQ